MRKSYLENLFSKSIQIYTDYSKVENQIGCGYCTFEKTCIEKEPLINKAKLGCVNYKHWSLK